jgi:hypothetical protein
LLGRGTYRLTKKKSRTADDFPFHKITNSALKKVPRGYKRQATQEIFKDKRHIFTVQATSWKDRKQVGFLHNNLVQPTKDYFVKRYVKSQQKRQKISSHEIVSDYSKYMSGVDHKDRDTADWTVSLKSNRWYLRIFYWLIDGVLHAAYRIVVSVAKDDNHKWHKYLSKNGGRYKFQMDLGLALISYGIGMDWEEGFDEDKKPPYMRKSNYVPCGCKRCFFCKNGKTQGVDHKRAGRSLKQAKKCPEKRTSLVRKSRYCKSCYSKIREEKGTSIGKAEIKKKCNYSSMGCSVCEVRVCKECWSQGRPH